MGDDAGEPANDWRSIDREQLADLLSSGLTPAEVGELFGRSADSVRLRARRWQLDCRALRARAIGLTAKPPDVAAQFVEVVDGAPLGHTAEDLLAGSGARCRWRCDECGEEWVTSVANRTKRRSGCPACADRHMLARARARSAKTPPLSAVSEELVSDFVENLSRPDRDAYSTPSGSQDRILWRCRSRHEWETSARQRVKYRTQCPPCLVGLWTSRLEHEVAALVQLATGLEVRVGATKARIDRKARDTVDLHIVAADFLCDLDPSRWHRATSAVDRDLRKLERHADQRYARIRPACLGRLPSERARDDQQVMLAPATTRPIRGFGHPQSSTLWAPTT